MNDDERGDEIRRLREQLSDATKRKAALAEEAVALAARLPEIRAEFGNPFSYSTPDHADESVSHYTGYSSHAVILPTIRALRRVEGELRDIKERLLALGVHDVE